MFAGSLDGLTSQLWITDGTTAGTQELSTIRPNDIAVYGNDALFSGQTTANGGGGLWVTDGTATGTKELSSSTSSIATEDITAFGNDALFGVTDASSNFGMWVTNGTTAGTRELTNIPGAYASGIAPSFMTVLG